MGENVQVRQRIEDASDNLTGAERKLASALLADYPFAGLETIQTLADRTKVSAPSITRFLHKIGCQGYQDFQRCLIEELKERQWSPIDIRKATLPTKAGHLADYVERAAIVARSVADNVTEDQFERVCALLSDESRSVYVLGGRISESIGTLLSRHLRQMRRHVFQLPGDPEQWPEYLLRMRSRDILVIFDFRRYQRNLEEAARLAALERQVRIVLITDKWMSPISGKASEILAVPIENGTAWDCWVGAVALVEAIIGQVSETNWEATRTRIEAWDALRLNHERVDV